MTEQKKIEQPKADKKTKIGRPSEYTEEKGLAICAEMASGRSLRSICNDEGMPDKTTVFRWLASFPDFHTQYARAQEDRAASFAEEILEIADDTDVVNVQKAKLQIDTRRWLMSKMSPKKFSDKLGITDGEGGALKVMIQRFGENKSSGDDNTSE